MRRFPGRNHSKLISKLDEEMSRSKTLTSSMKSAQFFELKAVYLYQQHEFVEAICLIDFVIGGSSSKNLIGLGKNFYFRGKCLQAMINHAVTLPVTLKSNDLSQSQSQQAVESVTFSDKGQVLQECIASFRKAYHYFGSVGDELRVAQTLSHIAKAFLDHLFFPVAFMRVPFSLLSRFDEFTVSNVVQPTDRKEDKRKVKEALIEPKEFVISLKNIEAPANLALDIASEIVNPILMLNWSVSVFFFFSFHLIGLLID